MIENSNPDVTASDIAGLRAEVDVLRGAVGVLAGAAMLAMDARQDRTALLRHVAELTGYFEAHVVGDCPGHEQRMVGSAAMMDFLTRDVRNDDGTPRPKPVSLDFLGKQHGQLLQQVIGVVDRERERDQVIRDLVASLQAALGPKQAEQS